MEVLSTTTATAWVLLWLAAIGLYFPAVALGSADGRSTKALEMGPGLVWAWLVIAVATPLTAAVHGFNWFTALLVSASWPVMLWAYRHRGGLQLAFNTGVRRVAFRLLTSRDAALRAKPGAAAAVMLALPLVAAWRLVPGQADLRLPMPAEFDTLSRTRQLLAGTTTWDPLASLAAVLTRVSSADGLSVAGAILLALVVLTAAAAGLLVAEASGRSWAGVATAGVVVVVAPHAPGSLWAVALVACIGATSVGRWLRHERSRDGWHSVAAAALLVGQLAPFLETPEILFQVSTTPRYLEYAAAPLQARRLARSETGENWMFVAPPEQQLALDGEGRSYDLARFVTRFQDRAGSAAFRFDLPARRIFVFVEKQPFEPVDLPLGVRFVAAQPAAYRVPRERWHLERLARRICDEYLRTHAGATVIYDGVDLRVYRFDV